MAFRKFSQPTPMRAAKIKGMPNLINSIQSNQVLKATERKEAADKQKAIDKQILDYDRSIAQGSYVQDQEKINKMAKKATNLWLSSLEETGVVSQEAQREKQNVEIEANKSNKQYKAFRLLEKNILDISKNDPYFDFGLANAKRVNEEMKPLEQRDPKNVPIEGDEYFLFDKYIANYITKQNETVKNPVLNNGNTIGHKSVSGQFLDDKGNIVVTDLDGKAFLNSLDETDDNGIIKGRLHNYYNNRLFAEYDKEVFSIRAGGAEWTKGLSHNEIRDILIREPHRNTMNGDKFKDRKLDMVIKDLRERARIDDITNTNSVRRGGSGTGNSVGAKEKSLQISAENRNNLIDEIVYDNIEASLSAVFGGIKGIKSYEFYRKEPAFPDYDKSGEVEGVTLMVPDPQHPGEFTKKDIPLKTKEDKLEARLVINKYLDDEVKGTTNYVGPERITIENAKIRKSDKESAKYTFGDKKYTHKDLINAGYTEEQIKQAIDMGNITINK